jgi:DNA-binding response OmpR family regulator
MLLNQADRLVYAGRSAGGRRLLVGDAPLALPERRILLAQGDPYTAGAISRRLEREGFLVLHCSDGVSALQRIDATDVSLVIVDVDLPRLDGFSLVARLRGLKGHGETPVLMLAGLGEEAHIVRAFESGADDYLLKPFASPDLIARVRRLLTPRRSRTGDQDAPAGS